MPLEMSEIKAVAKEHIQRDVAAGGTWVCSCESCLGMRSLVGMEKILLIRPLVREIELLEDQLSATSPGSEHDDIRKKYERVSDQLAAVMAK